MYRHEKYRLYLQDEDAEPDTSCACSPHDGHKVHDQYSSKETGLEAIHGKECPRLQCVAYEEYDGEDVDEETDDDEQHKDHDTPALCQYILSKVGVQDVRNIRLREFSKAINCA